MGRTSSEGERFRFLSCTTLSIVASGAGASDLNAYSLLLDRVVISFEAGISSGRLILWGRAVRGFSDFKLGFLGGLPRGRLEGTDTVPLAIDENVGSNALLPSAGF